MINPDFPLRNLPRVSPKYHKALEKLGLQTVRDLLFYFPFRYEDFSKIVLLDHPHINETITVQGRVTKTKLTRIFKRNMAIAEVIIQDQHNTPMKAIWFNQPYILESLKEGVEIRLSGKLELEKKMFFMNSPAWEKSARDITNTGCLVPVYRETQGVTSKWLRWQIKLLLPLAKNIPDVLPRKIREKFKLYELATALGMIHFPTSLNKLVLAQKRFAFQEMFLAQLHALRVKKNWEQNQAISIKFDNNLIKQFVTKLPFKLTNAQRKASFEILRDLEKKQPMNRLLNGDVGSGKTVVAAIASLRAMSANCQVALMAPTEILAQQHFENFVNFFSEYKFNIALLTNSYKLVHYFSSGKKSVIARESLLKKICAGKIDLIIGTRAIIQKDIQFNNLVLVVIDEQHRFGVAQRAKLQQETARMEDGAPKTIPHSLSMTATPIPRTLAIAFFGSLNLSLLDEMPKKRKQVITKIISSKARISAYNFIRHEIQIGRQAFIILPLIEESKILMEVKAAKQEYERLAKDVFPEFKLGLLHGKLKSKEKDNIMSDFVAKKIDILVATSVVEVGIDIPNATIMMIENAERFGLTQLHQSRGRVGRGEYQSYCFLFCGSSVNPIRLKVLEETLDGFIIAQKDLELRGPGQFFGILQSGLPDIAMENLSNIKLIKFARNEAQEILTQDPELKKYPALKQALKKFQEKVHLE